MSLQILDRNTQNLRFVNIFLSSYDITVTKDESHDSILFILVLHA